MGHVPVTISIKGEKPQQTDIYQAMQSAFDYAKKLEAQLSEYQSGSEIACINKNAGKSFCKISQNSLELIYLGELLRKHSSGAFDIRYASLKLPLATERWFKLNEQKNRIKILFPDIKVGLSSLSKGFIVDAMMRYSLLNKYDKVMIVAGGDSLAKGGPWKIYFQIPAAKLGKKTYPLLFQDQAVGTSGSYEQGSHIQDPRIKTAVIRQSSVSVLGKDLTLANALATTLFVLGPNEGAVFLKQYPNYQAIWINEHGKALHY